MSRTREAIFSLTGAISGAVVGAAKGSHIGLAFGGPGGAMAATIPFAVIGFVTGGLAANKLECELSRVGM